MKAMTSNSASLNLMGRNPNNAATGPRSGRLKPSIVAPAARMIAGIVMPKEWPFDSNRSQRVGGRLSEFDQRMSPRFTRNTMARLCSRLPTT